MHSLTMYSRNEFTMICTGCYWSTYYSHVWKLGSRTRRFLLCAYFVLSKFSHLFLLYLRECEENLKHYDGKFTINYKVYCKMHLDHVITPEIGRIHKTSIAVSTRIEYKNHTIWFVIKKDCRVFEILYVCLFEPYAWLENKFKIYWL